MSYFIFNKNLDNIDGSIYRIAENQSDFNYLNIIQSDYKIIEDSQSNFNLVKFADKYPSKYNNNTITYVDQNYSYIKKEELQTYVDGFKIQIKQFLDNNLNHPLFSRWNNYYNQLNNLNFDNINYPLTMSLEKYFNNLGQTSLNPLQIP